MQIRGENKSQHGHSLFQSQQRGKFFFKSYATEGRSFFWRGSRLYPEAAYPALEAEAAAAALVEAAPAAPIARLPLEECADGAQVALVAQEVGLLGAL